MFQDKFVLADGTALQSNIVGVDWTTSSNSDSDIAPGSVCASAVEIEFWVNSDSALIVTQGTVLTYYKVYKDDNDIGIETKIGVFTCDKPEKTGSNKYKVTAYDNVTLLDVDVSEWLNALTFPITIKEFAAALAAKCELELANEPRLNKDYQVQKFTGSGVKARDLMKMVCSASGCFCNADADGKLFFDWYKKNERVTISPQKSTSAGAISFYLFDVVKRSLQDNAHRVLISAKSGGDAPDGIPYFANQLTFSDFVVKAIDKVQVRQSDDDVGVVYPADEQGTNALVIQGNQLLSTTSDAALRPYVKNLYDGLNNITYVPCSNIQTPETLEIKVGDIVTVSDGKNEFDTWITSVKHSGGKCTFESVGNANRNTTTAVNNAQYNARQKTAELKASVDGISARLSEYSTTEEMNAAIDIGMKKINISVSEKTASDNLMDGFSTSAHSTGTTGSATFDENNVATVIAPGSSEPDARSGAVYYMPIKNLSAIKGAYASISVDYKVNETVSIASPTKSSVVVVWLNYASGNTDIRIVDFLKNPEPSDWQTATVKFTSKDETPTKVYFYAYIYGGTGSISIKNPVITFASNKESIISLTKDGTVISAGELNLNQFATNTELKVGIDGLSATVVKNGEIRSKFALDSSNCTIQSGVITFKSNTLVVDSTNFKLSPGGSVSITGTFNTNNGINGAGRNEVRISSGMIDFYRINSSSMNNLVLRFYGTGGNSSMGSINVFGDGAEQAALYSSLTGAVFYLKNSYGNQYARLFTDNYGHGCFVLNDSSNTDNNTNTFFSISTSADGRPHVSFDGELECRSIKRNGQYI